MKRQIAFVTLALATAGAAYAAGRAEAPSGKGYVVAEINVTDPEAYEVYKPKAAAAIAHYGGKYLVRGGKAEAVEGDPPAGRIVVLEFESVAQAMAFENSPEYRAAAAIRQKAAKTKAYVVEGMPE